MSANVPLLPPGQPHSKAAPTAQLVTSQAAANNEADAAKPVQSDNARAKMSRTGRDTSSTDPTSTQTTLALIQRVLVPNKPGLTDTTSDVTAIEDILPPLTSSNDVDVELYAILAIIVKDFVNTWYTKITPDHDFVEEIVQIFAHCSRALEQRLRQIDRTTLFMDEVPLLIQHHLDAYRTAKSTTLTSPHTGSLRQIYHELMPHPALTPVPLDDRNGTTELLQQSHERAYCQLLVQGSLGILLPTEDLQNGPLRVLVGDIVADLIIGQALAGKIGQAWFLHDAVRKVTALVSGKIQPKVSGSEYRDDAANRLEQFGLLSSNSAPEHRHSSTNTQSQMVTWFWRIMQYGYMVYLFSIFILKEAHTVRSKPARVYRSRVEASKVHLHVPNPDDQSVQPVIAFGVYAMISTLLRMADRIPWTTGILEFCQHILLRGIGHVGRANSYLDRFLYHAIETHVLPSSLLPVVLRNLRVALFPNNTMGPPAPPPPSPEEAREIKHEAAKTIASLLPAVITRRYYAANDDSDLVDQIEQDMLEAFDDVYLNKHLIYAILELILVRLIPELGQQTITDLLADRGIGSDEDFGPVAISPDTNGDENVKSPKVASHL